MLQPFTDANKENPAWVMEKRGEMLQGEQRLDRRYQQACLEGRSPGSDSGCSRMGHESQPKSLLQPKEQAAPPLLAFLANGSAA